MRKLHQHADRHQSAEEFDDDFDEVEDFLSPNTRAVFDDVGEQILPSDAILIEQELGTALTHERAGARITHYFAECDLGYKPISADSFKLRVRGSRHPWFGSFAGVVHIIEQIGTHESVHTYRISGVLRYRLSIMYTAVVAIGVFVLLYVLHPGFWPTAVFYFLLVGGLIAAGYALGKSERDEVQKRVEESFLRLRSTFSNRA